MTNEKMQILGWNASTIVVASALFILLTVTILGFKVPHDQTNEIRKIDGKNVLIASTNHALYPSSQLDGVNSESNFKVINSKNFGGMIEKAVSSARKRKMTDLTKAPEQNSMQTLVNTW